MTERQVWSHSVGVAPKRVTVVEMTTRDGTLYLRWRPGFSRSKKWKHESLGKTLRTKDGKIIEERRRWAKERVQKKYDELVAARSAASPKKSDEPLTLKQGLARAIDTHLGKYPADTAHRREVIRSMEFAIQYWGEDRIWNSIRRADLRALGRARMDQLIRQGESGHRGAEVVVTHVLTVANWLRGEELIDEEACHPEQYWKQRLREYWMGKHDTKREPEPHQPRYTPEEMGRLLDAAPRVDPRLALLVELGAGLRLGQVVRGWRRDLNLEENTLRVIGMGRKKAPTVELNDYQRAAVDRALAGYLRELEAAFLAGEIANYPLFPSGQMPGSRSHLFREQKSGAARSPHGPAEPTATVERHANAKPLTGTTWRDWWHDAEEIAGVVHLDGRGPYGIKRTEVDLAKEEKISREGLKEFGGWSDTQMPDRVYADQEAKVARREARDGRPCLVSHRRKRRKCQTTVKQRLFYGRRCLRDGELR
jgi:hypothetical protein